MKERTTVRLDGELMRQARLYALESGTTLTSLIEQSLRERLARPNNIKPQTETRLRTFLGDGVMAGVDLDDGVALRDRMDGLES